MMVEIAVDQELIRHGAHFANVLIPTAVQLPMLLDVSMLIGKGTGKFGGKIGTPFLLYFRDFFKVLR